MRTKARFHVVGIFACALLIPEARAREPYDSLEEFAESVARIEGLCPARLPAALVASVDAINSMPERAGEAPLRFNNGSAYEFLDLVANAASRADNNLEIRRLLRVTIDAMIRSVDQHGSYLDFSERNNVNPTQPERLRVAWSVRNRVGVIVIPRFDQSVSSAVREAVEHISRETPSPRGYVLDLRGNDGGLFQSVIATSDLFLDGGTVATVRPTESCLTEEARTYYARNGDIAAGATILVLVDHDTSSGAELFAAALSDNGRARLVGQRTHGDALLHTVLPSAGRFARQSALRLTAAELVPPSGISFHGIGLEPSIVIERTDGQPGDLLDAAILLLSQ